MLLSSLLMLLLIVLIAFGFALSSTLLFDAAQVVVSPLSHADSSWRNTMESLFLNWLGPRFATVTLATTPIARSILLVDINGMLAIRIQFPILMVDVSILFRLGFRVGTSVNPLFIIARLATLFILACRNVIRFADIINRATFKINFNGNQLQTIIGTFSI